VTRDGYLGTARPAWHPAFSCRATALACPACRQFIALTVTEYDRHFTGHHPAREQAYGWLSGRSHDRLAARRGWPLTAHLVSEGKS
jgi:uncharacterized protein YbaR (Trm112 family)